MIASFVRRLAVLGVGSVLSAAPLAAQSCSATGNRGTCSLSVNLGTFTLPTLRVVTVPNPLSLVPASGTTVTGAMYEQGFFDTQPITISVRANAAFRVQVSATGNFTGGGCATSRAAGTLRYSTGTLAANSPTLPTTPTDFWVGSANTTNAAQTQNIAFRVPLSWTSDGPSSLCTLNIAFRIAP